MSKRPAGFDLLRALMLAYGAATLLHFSHNAIYIDEYPNLPEWLSAAKVWITWFVETSLGVAGYVLLRSRYRIAGLALTAAWAALGFDGLAHYSLAPFSAHTWDMNLTIWTEVVTATVLLLATMLRFAAQLRARRDMSPRFQSSISNSPPGT